MIALARLALGFDSGRDDVVEVHADSVDVDTLMERLARMWYADLLDNAPLHMLKVTSITGASVAFGTYVGGGSRVELPPHCRRCSEISLPGWKGSATPLPHSEAEALTACQLNPYTAATDDFPVAVMSADSRSVHCWPAMRMGSAMTVAVRGVVDPGDDIYVFDESALPSFAAYVALKYKEICVNPSI